jgi:hypothetical protein
MKQLTRAGITLDPKERTDMALYYLKSIEEFNAAIQEWEAKPAAKKHGETLNLSCQQNVQRKTSNANSQQSNWEQMQTRSKLMLQRKSLQTYLKRTHTKLSHSLEPRTLRQQRKC